MYSIGVIDWQKEWVRKNFVRLNIFFEDKTLEMTVQIPSYGLVDLCADIGGILGLWAGISIITVIEIVSFIFNLCVIMVHRGKDKWYHVINKSRLIFQLTIDRDAI